MDSKSTGPPPILAAARRRRDRTARLPQDQPSDRI